MPDINDFVLKVATVNGTGSASANTLLMKSIFRMGIPVVGKNFFPSNIQGLPTWYEIRVSREGYLCRSGRVDVMVAMNAETYAQDLAEVSPGGYLIYDATWPRSRELNRDDVTVIGIPFAQMCNEAFDTARVRILMKNIAYVGALAALLEIDLEVIRTLLAETFASKPKLVDGNMQAVRMGYDYAKEAFTCPLPLRLEPMDRTDGHVMIDGNTAAGLGCVYAGATVGAWYPITPSTSLMDAYKSFSAQLRVNPDTGEHNYCIVQAEDELAAAGMVLGANWMGARAFTPTSGPGISLMSEWIGFGYFTEIPAVLFDVQRVGPSTGMPTRTQQCDLSLCAYASHGDTKHPCLYPADPKECFELTPIAFDLAERLQTPVFVLTDLDIGMNDWMVPAFAWDDGYEPDRGKVLRAADFEKGATLHRYEDVDGDGIPWRSLPGDHAAGAFFTRGSGHDAKARYTEDADEYEALMERLAKKWETAKDLVPGPVFDEAPNREFAIVAIGSSDGAVREALDRLSGDGIGLNYMRLRAFPFNAEVDAFLARHERIFVVEQNRDAQLRTLLVNETSCPKEKLIPVRHYNGMPIDSDGLVAAVRDALVEVAAA
ncbi:MAG: 2-oxoacid:acceptor oxidoreductase subunit alpha [Pseudomonadota bacterium]